MLDAIKFYPGVSDDDEARTESVYVDCQKEIDHQIAEAIKEGNNSPREHNTIISAIQDSYINKLNVFNQDLFESLQLSESSENSERVKRKGNIMK